MLQQIRQPGFPIYQAIGVLSAVAGACLLGVYFLLPGLIAEPGPQLGVAILTIGLLVWFFSLVGLLPVVLLGPRGVMPTVIGYFVGMGLRMVLCMGTFFYVRFATDWPLFAVAATLALMYVPLLMAEVAFVGKYLWAKDALDVARPRLCVKTPGGVGNSAGTADDRPDACPTKPLGTHEKTPSNLLNDTSNNTEVLT